VRRSDRILRHARRAAALLPPALVPLVVPLAACSTYRAAVPEVVPAGARVRVQLTPEGAAALAPALGTSVSGVEGEWAGGAGDSVVVRVARLLTVPGVTMDWNGTAVGMPRGAVRSVERATVSGQRTVLLVAGGVAVVAALVAAIVHGGKAQGGQDGGTSPF
jgi:hypothetical protein